MKDLLKQFGLPNYLKGDSFAKDSKRITTKIRGKNGEFNSPEDIATEQDLLGKLQQAQEFVKQGMEQQAPTTQHAGGGFMDFLGKAGGSGMGSSIGTSAAGLLQTLDAQKGGYQNEAIAGISGGLAGAGTGMDLGMEVGGPLGAGIGAGVGFLAGGAKSLFGAKEANEAQKLENRTNAYQGAYGTSSFALGGEPLTGDPTKPGQNVATMQEDGNVDLNGTILNQEGQAALFNKKYTHTPDQPYLGKYGSTYAGQDGMEAKGAGIMSYDQGQIKFNQKYNRDMQEQYMDKVRGLPENEGRDMYLHGSQNPKYMAPRGYQAGVTTETRQLATGGPGPGDPPDFDKAIRDLAVQMGSASPDDRMAYEGQMNSLIAASQHYLNQNKQPQQQPQQQPQGSSANDWGQPGQQQNKNTGTSADNVELGDQFNPKYARAIEGKTVGFNPSEINPGMRDYAQAIQGNTKGINLGGDTMGAPLTRFDQSKLPTTGATDTTEEDKTSTIAEQLARTAPVLANMYNLANLKRPKTNASAKLTGRYKENRIDEKALQNQVGQQTAATREAILSSSGGSGSAARANLLAAQRQGSGALSDAYLKANRINAQESQTAQQFNNRNAMVNLQQSNRDMDLNAADKGAYDSNKSKLIAQIGSDIGSMGKEALYRKYPFMAGMDYDSYGKYINSAKKKTKK